MADAMMMFLGEAHGVKWYWAQPGEFENPGVYYWDGAKNVLCVPHLAAAPEAPAIDYEALIKAAEDSNPRWAQGTMGCVAFKEGAEWYRAQVLYGIPAMLTRCRYDGHCQHAINCLDEDQACPKGQCKHPKVKT